MFLRRTMRYGAVLSLCLGAAAAVAVRADVPDERIPITVMSANLSSSTSQEYEEPAIRIFKALKPDVVGIQEFNYRDGGPAALVARAFGPEYHYFCEKGAALPNGVISRWPIRATGSWLDPYVKNRTLVWATLEIPGPRPLHVVSVHLVQNRAERRVAQARFLAQKIRTTFPADDYLVLCGDFNIATRASMALAELTDLLSDEHQPADQHGNPGTNTSRDRPYDFVLPNARLNACHVPTRVANRVFAQGLVFDSRVWDPPPAPVRTDDTTADNMQHMPVMKTFAVPAAAPQDTRVSRVSRVNRRPGARAGW